MSTVSRSLKENKWATFGILILFIIMGVVFFPKLSLERRLLDSALTAVSLKEWASAAQDFERVVRYSPNSSIGVDAARRGGEVALYQLKDFNKAIFFFRHVVRKSISPTEMLWAQQMLADIYYEKLSNYPQAIVELNRLLQGDPPKAEILAARLKIAKAYFYMANFDQAIAEVKSFEIDFQGDPRTFDAKIIKGNALLALKRADEAIAVYQDLIKTKGNLKETYQLYLNMSIAYEEKGDFEHSIEGLKLIRDYYPHPDVIDLKIKSVTRRKEKKKDS